MSLLLHGDDVEDVSGVVVGLTSAQMVQLRREGRVSFSASQLDGSPTVVVGHDDDMDSLAEEVGE